MQLRTTVELKINVKKRKKAKKRISVVNKPTLDHNNYRKVMLFHGRLFGWRSHTTGQFPEDQKLEVHSINIVHYNISPS